MWVTKLLISQVKKKDCLPQNDQIWPKIGIFGQFGPGHAGFFDALLVGRLVVVARRLYLARHLFTLQILLTNSRENLKSSKSAKCKLISVVVQLQCSFIEGKSSRRLFYEMLPPIELRIALVKSIIIASPNVLVSSTMQKMMLTSKKIPKGVFNPQVYL